MEKRTLYHVGPGRSRISTRRLEHLLLKHRSELYTLTLKLDDYKVERGTYRLQLLQTKIKKLVNTAVLFGAIQ